jgi:hypothetical protein
VSIIQGPFPVAPCQTLVSRFATFSSLYAGHVEAIKVLLAAGADVNHAAKDGRTPLATARDPERGGGEAAALALVQAGAKE